MSQLDPFMSLNGPASNFSLAGGFGSTTPAGNFSSGPSPSNSGSPSFMQPLSNTQSGVGSVVPGQIQNVQTNNPQLNQFSNLLQSLMHQSQSAYNQNLGNYKNLQSSVNNNLQGMGNLANQQINMGLQNQMGGMNQNMVTRGLGNSTVQNTMGQGLQRNAQMEHQQVNENVAQQKNATQMQMFGMNPAFNSQQYLSLLPQLGNLAASGMVK